ncbi:MAG: helix-turn-helix transcriptional regulator [Planctomycetaceae bacterium]|nr:helix-turn-helix transcriptional regulator [Planctomycetaceae bacterium]
MGSDTEKELHQRFVAVCEQHTQAEVARRTGIPAHYIYRYVKGTRIPAELCSRLVEGLNINPAWLLAGQGAMSLSEVSDQVSSMAKDMTELVKAMAAVSRMKLGSLTGKERNRIFRELSETLAAYEALRNDLRRKTRPYLEELLQDMARALEQHKLERAGELKTAIEQLVPLCDNEKLELDQLGLFANYHFKQLDFARALDYRRESFSRMFRNKARLTPEDARECTAFGRVLIQNGHLVEARGLLKGFRAMVESYSQGWREMHPLCMLFGWSELELGNMLEGRSLIEQSFAHMDDEHRNLTAGIVLRAALYAGK